MKKLSELPLPEKMACRDLIVAIIKPYGEVVMAGASPEDDEAAFMVTCKKMGQDPACVKWIRDNCPHLTWASILSSLNVRNAARAQVFGAQGRMEEMLAVGREGAALQEQMETWWDDDVVQGAMQVEKANYFRWRMEFFEESKADAAKKIGLDPKEVE